MDNNHVNRVQTRGNVGSHHHNFQPRICGNNPVLNFSVCTETESGKVWHQFVAFDDLAVKCSQILKKGKLVSIEGALTISSVFKNLTVNGKTIQISVPETRIKVLRIWENKQPQAGTDPNSGVLRPQTLRFQSGQVRTEQQMYSLSDPSDYPDADGYPEDYMDVRNQPHEEI